MLSRLHIENIAVIEQAEIEFESGLNVLTGETGAGKSILVDSIMAVLGERTSRELVRTGAQAAYVSAEFTGIGAEIKKKLEEMGYSCEDESIMLGREIKVDGKAVFRVNGRPANAAALREVGRLLIDIHGQHDSQALLSPEQHIFYIDSMLSDKHLIADFQQKYDEYRAASAELRSICRDESEKARRIDMLRYQINEIESAEICVGEAADLEKRRDMCLNAEKIVSAENEAHAAINGEDEFPGALATLGQAVESLTGIAGYSDDIRALLTRLDGLVIELDDIGSELRDLREQLEFDPYELDNIMDRLEQLKRIFRKYGDEAQTLEYLENAQAELEQIELSDERRALLEEECAQKLRAAKNAAELLHNARCATANEFAERVCAELAFLDMPSVEFLANIEPHELYELGTDTAEFLISANAGEPPKPIHKIASGGELSRIMLAIKNVLAENDSVDTLIFDEIDTGVSGRAAHKIGLKLKETSKHRQIICITHLSQIAAKADTHMLISKHVESGRTYTVVDRLSFDERVRELARISVGEHITEAAMESSRELLEQSGITE